MSGLRIAKTLLISEEEVEQAYDGAILKLKNMLGLK